jgi:hypothetical protein
MWESYFFLEVKDHTQKSLPNMDGDPKNPKFRKS